MLLLFPAQWAASYKSLNIAVMSSLVQVPELSLRDRYDFCTAPVNTRDQTATSHLLRIAIEYCRCACTQTDC